MAHALCLRIGKQIRKVLGADFPPKQRDHQRLLHGIFLNVVFYKALSLFALLDVSNYHSASSQRNPEVFASFCDSVNFQIKCNTSVAFTLKSHYVASPLLPRRALIDFNDYVCYIIRRERAV